DDLAAVEGEELQQGVLARRQPEFLAGPTDGAAAGVDLQVVDAEQRAFDGVRAADQGAEAGEQFLQLERLGQVVVGAEVEALDLVLDAAAGGEDEDVGRQGLRAAAPLLQQRQAVLFGQHQVEDDDVVPGGAGLEIALLAV